VRLRTLKIPKVKKARAQKKEKISLRALFQVEKLFLQWRRSLKTFRKDLKEEEEEEEVAHNPEFEIRLSSLNVDISLRM
jgi:hypothetical protein